MVAWSAPPVEVLEIVPPINLTNPHPAIYVFDFGVRRAGVVRLKNIACAAGHTIVLRHGEIRQHPGLPDLHGHVDTGMIYTGNLRSAKATDVYTCKGGTQSWAPRLTYHGFRFLELNVTQAPGLALTLESVEMVHFASSLQQRLHVHFASDTLNKLQAMALGAQASNLMTLPTDCDQRDERLGWMGDLNLSGESIALNYGAASFLAWWVRYVAVPELGADGSLPDVSPFVRYGNRPADVSWGAVLPTILYQLWHVYGELDTYRDVGRNAILQHVANVREQATSAGGLGKMHTPYGDWCPPPATMGGGQGVKPSRPLTSAYSYIDIVQKGGALAAASGNVSGAASFSALATQLIAEYNAAFAHANGTYDTGTQTALALSLSLGAAADANATQRALLAAVTSKHTHSFTGIIGSSRLYQMLDGAGASDTALAVLSQTSYPSFGYAFANSLEKTTTNMWELPDAPLEGTGMNSRNHHMYSSFSAYLVTGALGLSQVAGSTAHRHIELRPSRSYALHSASATLELSNGVVHFGWERSGGRQYDKAAEGDAAHWSCGPRGGVITAVEFASFGAPIVEAVPVEALEASASSSAAVPPLVRTPCHAARSEAVVAERCVGRASCTIPVSRTLFAMSDAELASCHTLATMRAGEHSEPLRLWAAVTCAKEDSIDATVRVPVGTVATMRMPTRSMAAPTLLEGGVVVDEKRADEVRVHRESGVLVAQFGSGEYEFVLQA